MLILLFLGLWAILGGAAGLEDRIEDAVADEVRRRAALVVVERVEAIKENLEGEVEATSNSLRELHLRYDASREDYLEALGPLEEVRRETARRLLEARMELQGILTAAEWSEVFPAPED